MTFSAVQKSQFRSWKYVVRSAAQEAPDGKAFEFLGAGPDATPIDTYGALDHQARKVAAALQLGGHAGSRAVLMYPPGPDASPACWAASTPAWR